MSYLEFLNDDGSNITIQHYDKVTDIPYRDNENSVPKHKHNHHELVLITRGSCLHVFKDTVIPLIPGDVFLIPSDQAHGYLFNSDDIGYRQCQFFPEKLGKQCMKVLNSFSDSPLNTDKYNSLHFVIELEDIWQKEASPDRSFSHSANINQQGIIHLSPSESRMVEDIFRKILYEQEARNYGYRFIKQSYLELVLVLVKRVQLRQFHDAKTQSTRQEMIITKALDYIEAHYNEDFDFIDLANKEHISLNYFRTLFKRITGLTPVDYLNRLRIIKSLNLLQTTDIPIIDIAVSAGIYDANYFTRLFKKIIGYSPSYFKQSVIYPNGTYDSTESYES